MKVVIVSNRDLKGGGAYLAALRLTRALRSEGIDVRMLVKEKQSEEPFVKALTGGNPLQRIEAFVKEYAERLYLFTQIKLKKDRFNFSLGKWGLPIEDHPLIQEADVVHFHWINKSFVSLDTINNIGKAGKSLVWTMHDMWSFTGGCHYAGTCENFKTECHNCPLLKNSGPQDYSQKTWQRKADLYSKVRIEGVTCSTWLEKAARDSALWPDSQVRTINNAIDTTFFSPDESAKDDRIRRILFIARDINDRRKGIDLLKKAMDLMVSDHSELSEKCELIIGGGYKEKIDFPVPHKYLGFLNNVNDLRAAYHQADVFVLPSREDNLPNTLVEASACGLVSVAFAVGGIPEMIKDSETGFLIEPENVKRFNHAIVSLMSMPLEELNKMKGGARNLAVQKYSPRSVARKYTELYQSMLD